MDIADTFVACISIPTIVPRIIVLLLISLFYNLSIDDGTVRLRNPSTLQSCHAVFTKLTVACLSEFLCHAVAKGKWQSSHLCSDYLDSKAKKWHRQRFAKPRS